MRDADFWREKRVFLTGHTGFKGSWLSLKLQMLGAEVAGYGLPSPTEPSLFEVAKVASGMVSIIGDVRDLGGLTRGMRDFSPGIVIHMAAQPLVRESYVNPVETYSTNVMGTVHLLEAVRQIGGVSAVVVVTSDKCYKNHEWLWGYRENDELGGFDPYSNSKACAELVAAAYRNAYFHPEDYKAHGVALATTRAGNVIGGGDWSKDRLVPDTMRSLLANEPVRLRNPLSTRPWQHVLEPLYGYLLLAERLYNEGPLYAESWNFGPDDASVKNVAWMVEQLHLLWGSDKSWDKDHGYNPHEDASLKLDSSKARSRLSWQPQLSLNTALRWIVDWYRAFEVGEDMRSVTEAQIREFGCK